MAREVSCSNRASTAGGPTKLQLHLPIGWKKDARSNVRRIITFRVNSDDRLLQISRFLASILLAGLAGCQETSQSDRRGDAGAADLKPGLRATYRDGRQSVRLVTTSPNFYLSSKESLHPSLDIDFEADWEGVLSILETGHYQFESSAELEIGGERIGDGAMRLVSGLHRVKIHYRRHPGPAQLRLQWKSEHFLLEPVPSRVFSHSGDEGLDLDQDRVELGRDLVESRGCLNCHESGSASLDRRGRPDLSGVGGRLKPSWIYQWLLDPTAVRSDATMPALLDPQSAKDVAAFLSSLQITKPPMREVGPSKQDADRGQDLYSSLGCMACHSAESLSLEAVGSKMSVESLAEYLKDPLAHSPGSLMPSMHLNDQEAFQLAAHLTRSRKNWLEESVEGGSEARGKFLLLSSGCLSCHDLSGRESDPDEGRATALEELSLDSGCLSQTPGPQLPRYRLDKVQRAAIRAFLDAQKKSPDISPAPVYDFYRRLRRLRCTACHQLDHLSDGWTGVPVLTAGGEKLQPMFLKRVLLEDVRLRSWLSIRMPQYDRGHVEPFTEAFAKASGLDPSSPRVEPVTSQAQLGRGLKQLGRDAEEGGLGCVGCHDWGDHQVSGERGPQLVQAALRLRYEWYRRFMLDPSRILSGTSMPAHFTDIEQEEFDASTQDIWAALGVDAAGPLPGGLAPGPDPWAAESRPRPSRRSVLVRAYMPEATPAAIAVGMPGGISYCFDAGSCRLLYAWKDGFLDLEETLQKKIGADGFTPTAQIEGRRFFQSTRFPFMAGSSDRQLRIRFRGYQWKDGSPEFHYQVGGASVYERVLPIKEAAGFRWRFRIERVDTPLRFAANLEGPVEIVSSSGIAQQGSVHIPIEADVRFEIMVRIKGER